MTSDEPTLLDVFAGVDDVKQAQGVYDVLVPKPGFIHGCNVDGQVICHGIIGICVNNLVPYFDELCKYVSRRISINVGNCYIICSKQVWHKRIPHQAFVIIVLRFQHVRQPIIDIVLVLVQFCF